MCCYVSDENEKFENDLRVSWGSGFDAEVACVVTLPGCEEHECDQTRDCECDYPMEAGRNEESGENEQEWGPRRRTTRRYMSASECSHAF